MAVIDHDDTFTINDVTFTVPPTQISIQKDSANYEWQTLRTKNSQKVKSGHGTINISFSAIFVGREAINNQLRLLVAQLRLTPICYAENQYLRDSLLPDDVLGNADKSICLILKAMSLTVQPELKDSVVAQFTFALFNYLPFTDRLTFKRDIFDPRPERTPARSLAWKKFYRAEMGELAKGGVSSKYSPITELESTLSFLYKEFFIYPAGDPDLAKQLKNTHIKYQSSDVTKNDFTLWSLDRQLACNSSSERIVTSVTVSFENIIAALPVVGHQYMTYQHIGSIDPRVIITMSVMSDLARQDLISMWNKIEQNALDWRHIPQEFLNVTIENNLTQMAGLKTFITDSFTDETVPGQPGTYQITLSLRGTDYLHTREGIAQEFVTTQKLRNKIIEIIRPYLTTAAGERGTTGPNFAKTDERSLFYNVVDNFSKLLTKTVQKVRGAFYLGSSNAPDLIGDGSPAQRLLLDVVVETLAGNAPKIPFSTTASQSGVARFPADSFLGSSLDKDLEDFSAAAANFADNLTLDGSLDLPEFAEAKKLAELTGAFKGKSAYPDFDALEDVAQLHNVNSLDLNPDFYFFTTTRDSLQSIIDPGYLQAAEKASKFLYLNDGQTGSDVGNYINSISNYMENTYINRFDPKSDVKKSLTASSIKIEKMYADGRSDLKSSKIQQDITAGISWTNALADGRNITSQNFGSDYVNLRPDEGTEVPFKAGSTPIVHFGDFQDILQGDLASYSDNIAQQIGVMIYPVPSSTPISSPFGPRDISAQNPEASHDHKGIDLACSAGTAVKSILDGQVIRADGNDVNGFGNLIQVQHANGLSSRYAHLSRMYVTVGTQVKGGTVIGRSGGAAGMQGAGNSKGAHLHFEILRDGVPVDPKAELDKAQGVSRDSSVSVQSNPDNSVKLKDSSSGEGFQFGSSIFARSIESLETDLTSGQGQSMIRAYPTFKLYFMEEDQDDRIFGFDDFFNYNAVKSIRVVRSRKVPTDLCVIELTNVSGILSNRKFKNTFNDQGRSVENLARNGDQIAIEDATKAGLAKNTADENSITSIMLQEGTKVFLRLGYSNDPEKLEPVFIGQVAEVEFNDTDDLVTIVCQSYASELVQQTKGLDAPVSQRNSFLTGGWLLGWNKAATPRLLSEMLQQPEVLHFGRWIRSRSGGIPSGTFDPANTTNTNLSILSNRFKWNPNPVDDNIFPPTLRSKNFESYFSVEKNNGWLTTGANMLLDTIDSPVALHFSPINYYIYKMTIWDIFKEMELRHPGCIASPVPYMDTKFGPRMTMFFGMPNQLYFARDPNYKEQARNNNILRTITEKAEDLRPELEAAGDSVGLLKDNTEGRVKTQVRGGGRLLSILLGATISPVLPTVGLPLLGAGLYDSMGTNPVQDLSNPSKTIINNQINAFNNQIKRENALKDRTVRPFRSYHVLTSNNHILENNIRASAIDVYNAAAVEYTVGGSLLDLSANYTVNGDKLQGKDKAVFRLKADAGIPDEEVREAFVQYPSCEGAQMAEFYALGTLKQTLRDIYKGQLTVIGNPTIKPYDVCYLFDEYTDMVGPVEVEQVIHSFSQQTGFITEITPDICVSINEWTTMATTDAVGLTVEGLLESVFHLKTRREATPQSRLGERFLGVDITTSNTIRTLGAGAVTFLISAPATYVPALGSVGALGVAATVASPLAVAAPFVLGGIFLVNKLVHWSKLRHPISFSPLMYKGRPFMAAMASKTINANWWTDLTGLGDGKGQNKGWLKEGLDGLPLLLNNIGDRLTLAADTGDLYNVGVSTTIPSSNPNP